MSTSKPKRIVTHWVQDERKSRTMKIFRKSREMWTQKVRNDRLMSGFAGLKKNLYLGPLDEQVGNLVGALK